MARQVNENMHAAHPGMEDARIPVALVACADYQPDHVYDALARAIFLLGGLDAFITPGTRVLAKPNLLQGLPPERAVCTHPAVMGAIIRLLNEHGCTVTLADSPGAGIRYTPKNLLKQYHGAGYQDLALDPGCVLNLDTGFATVKFMEGKVCKEFPLIAPSISSDHIIVVSKAKTHVLMLLTGATKNLFGLIPGLEKPLFHSRFQTGERFGDMLIDLNLLVKPTLQVADAILVMEGDGPTSGTPRHLGVILVSPSPLALDMVLCRIMSLEPRDVPYLKCAIERGLCAPDGSDLDLRGDPLSAYTGADIRKPGTYMGSHRGMRISPLFRAMHRLGRAYGLRPVVETVRCTGCGKCATICPARAITISGGHALIRLRTCIRCYCCHEMCTEGAISLKRTPAASLVHRVMTWDK
ncbi:MAG: DUF362 domain-containing protein [Methanolinea sp.]|nr:DUF362 domain-containing protein [Methanolinea sp.]